MASRYYAHTRALDAQSGDKRVAGGTYVAGDPMTEVVLRILRTPRGRYLPDPTFGVDYSVIQKAGAGVAAAWRAAVLAALDRLIKRNLITHVRVIVDTSKPGQLLYDVEFRDPRNSAREPTRLRELRA
jgi:phage baseplate assembly protein W